MSVCFGLDWGLNSGLLACKTGSLLLVAHAFLTLTSVHEQLPDKNIEKGL
jgi:hypothetical protein